MPKRESGQGVRILDETGEQTKTIASKEHESKGHLTITPETQLADCPTNLDLTTDRGKALAFNALGESDYAINAGEQVRIKATNYLVYPGESVDDETGEVSQYAWLVIFDASGKFVKTTSEVITQRLALALKMFSKSEWEAGIPLVIIPRQSRRTGRTYHDVRRDLDS